MPMFKIYVGNLDPRTTVETLKPYFEPFGEAVDEIILVADPDGEPRGFAIVLFRDPQLGQLAVETLTGKRINGREIQINEAVKKGKRILPVEEKAPRTSPLGPRAFQRPGAPGGFRPGAPRFGDSRPSGMASSRPGFGASAGGASRFNRNPRRAPGAPGSTGGSHLPPSGASHSAPHSVPDSSPSGHETSGTEQGAPSGSSAPNSGSPSDRGAPRPPVSPGPGSRSLGSPSSETPSATSRHLGGAPSMRPGAPRPPVPGGSSTQSRSLGGSTSRPIGGGGLPRPTISGSSRPLGASAPRPAVSPMGSAPRAVPSSPAKPTAANTPTASGPSSSAPPANAPTANAPTASAPTAKATRAKATTAKEPTAKPSASPAASDKSSKAPSSGSTVDASTPTDTAPAARPRAVKKKPTPEA